MQMIGKVGIEVVEWKWKEESIPLKKLFGHRDCDSLHYGAPFVSKLKFKKFHLILAYFAQNMPLLYKV